MSLPKVVDRFLGHEVRLEHKIDYTVSCSCGMSWEIFAPWKYTEFELVAEAEEIAQAHHSELSKTK